MFQIKSYLQYKNTPNGKPRVLREIVDYESIYNGESLWIEGLLDQKVANLSDCRPLYSDVIMHGEKWSDGDVGSYFSLTTFDFVFCLSDMVEEMNNDKDFSNFSVGNINRGSFFDDPAKYSKLLWNCSEEKGWKKVFDILGIK
jgi:hypothetical protein